MKRLIDSGSDQERELLGSLRAATSQEDANARARVAVALGLSVAAGATKTASAAVVASSSAASSAKALTGGALSKTLVAGVPLSAKALVAAAVLATVATGGALLVLREPESRRTAEEAHPSATTPAVPFVSETPAPLTTAAPLQTAVPLASVVAPADVVMDTSEAPRPLNQAIDTPAPTMPMTVPPAPIANVRSKGTTPERGHGSMLGPGSTKLPEVAASPPEAPAGGSSTTLPKAAEPTSPTQRELALLAAAKQKLESGEASSALAIVEAGAFSVLEQEALAVRIEGLARTGRAAEAKAEYERFLARFPASPHTGRLQRWVIKKK